MAKKTIKAEKLKAFIVTFYMDNEDNPKSVVVVAFNKEEAGKIFIKWLHAKGMYERVYSLVVQQTRKTRKNAHMITKEFYEKQNNFVNELYEKRKDA